GSTLQGVAALSASNIWAVGAYFNAGLSQTLIEHWDGATWSIVPSPNQGTTYDNYLYGVAALSANDVWAVGNYRNTPGYYLYTLTKHWDGATWSIVPSPSQ